MHVLVCTCFPARTSNMVKVLPGGVCVQQHVHMQILGMEHDLVLWVSRRCFLKPEQRKSVVFSLSRFQVVPLPSLGLLVPLQHLEAAWSAWLGVSLKLGALPPSHPIVFSVCLWCIADKFLQHPVSNRDWCRKQQHSILQFLFL